jgi:hypothetical protein
MYTILKLKEWIANPPDHVEVETAIELASQLLQQKNLNAALLKELCDSVELLS